MPKRPANIQILQRIFFELAYLYEIKGIPFKPRAYQLASESLSTLNANVHTTWQQGGIPALVALPAIGQGIAKKIDEFFRTGHIAEYDRLKQAFPVNIWKISRIEGLGPKHIADLYHHLHIQTLRDLERALAAHQLRDIPRWGVKSEQKIAHALQLMRQASDRHLLGTVLPIAETLVADLSTIPGVIHCAYAGSLRRRQETIGDIDLIATSSHPKRVMDTFVHHPLVTSIHEHGTTRSSVRLSIGIDADLRVVPDDVYGATLQYFTGDKRHNILLREYALTKGYTLNEYGLFRVQKHGKTTTKKLVACTTEESVYHQLGMDTPPPELRVGGDELQTAQKHTLPKLLSYNSLRGDLQVQTDWTDGSDSIENMTRAAQHAGLTYIAITDHTKSLAFIHGLDETKLKKQAREIQRVNKLFKNIHVLHGTECDIRQDGSLDLDNKALTKLDWVGVSIHSHFQLSRSAQTARLLKAIAHPLVDCIFHPTCRLIGKRDEIDIDIDEVIAAAKKYHVALEIDAAPERSDLRDIYVRAAVNAGVMLVIDSDAHAPDQFKYLSLGEAIARRGWAEKKNILNTKTYAEFKAYLERKRKRRL